MGMMRDGLKVVKGTTQMKTQKAIMCLKRQADGCFVVVFIKIVREYIFFIRHTSHLTRPIVPQQLLT